MREDSIFRIASMTKPITAVAVLMLMEEGKIHLNDAISKYLPALKNPTVAIETAGTPGHPSAVIVPANREITIRDLLTHTSGITYGAGSSRAEQLMSQAGITADIADQQVVEKIGRVPLLFQPGTAWIYGRSFDVLLALVEVVSGERADQFYERRIFRPLGMHDTFFNVPKDKLGRVAQAGPDPDTGKIPNLYDVAKTRTFMGGGEGLLSTASDYLRFELMLANGGELDGVRLLSAKTVAAMTSDEIGPGLARGPNYFPGPGVGYGYGVAVRTALSPGDKPGSVGRSGSVGAYFFSGFAGTTFRVDPAKHMVAVTLMQAPGRQQADANRAFYTLLYQAMVN